MKQYNQFQVGSTKVVFGRGASAAAGAELRTAGLRKAIIITDAFIASSGMLDTLTGGLQDAGIDYVVFGKVQSDPSSEILEEALDCLKASGCDAVIGIGGGSSMDTAKGVRILATNGGNIFDYDNSPTGGKVFRKQGLYLICVPTTAGTGSEVTPYAIITNKKENRKATITSARNYPEAALLDPELTLGLPKGITASTGMDAFAHALGGYTSNRVIGAPGSTVYTDTLALKAMELIARYLRTAVHCGSNYEARENMMMASLLGAMAANAGGDACHGLGHALGAVYHIPHGIACSAGMPYVMEYNAVACPERFATIARAMGVPTEGMSVTQAAEAAAREIRRLINDIELPAISDFVPNTEDETFELCVKQTVAEKCSALNPRPITEEVAREMLKKAYYRV